MQFNSPLRRNFRQGLVLLCSAAVSITGCSGGGSTGGSGSGSTGGAVSNTVIGNTPRYAFTANSTDNSLSSYAVDNGQLAYITRTPAGSSPVSVVVGPSEQHAYAVNSGTGPSGNSVSQFDINANGLLTPMTVSSVLQERIRSPSLSTTQVNTPTWRTVQVMTSRNTTSVLTEH